MKYENIIETVSAIVENEEIHKEGLILEYTLPIREHEKMDEHLFYKGNDRNAIFEHRDIILVEMAGINVRIVKESKNK